jgi:hypothetical protein
MLEKSIEFSELATRFFWTLGETEWVPNSFFGKIHPEALLDKDFALHQVCLSP